MILVTGATGNVGREAVDLLLERGEAVRAMTRDPARATLPPGVEAVQGDPSDEQAVVSALRDAAAVLLVVPRGATAVARALRRAAPDRVVLLSSLTVTTRPELAHADELRTTERTVRAAAPDATVLHPGQFASNTLQWRPMIEAGIVAAPFGDVAIPVIDPADIAAVAVAALTEDGHRGAVYDLSGPELLSARQRVEQVAAVLDRPLEFVDQSETDFRAASARVQQQLQDYLVAVQGRPTAAELTVFPTVQQVIGRAPRTFRDWAERHRALLAG